MSLNGSGVYVVNSSGQPVVANTLITSAAFNAFTADIATALSTAIFKDGQQTVAANIPFSGYKLTGVGAATARTDAATLASIQDGTGVYVATVGGTVDVITLTASPAITAYAAGQMFRFIAAGANTTNVTVNVSGLGAKAITKNGTTALVAADIPSGMMVQITYDGTRFILGTVANDSFIDTKAVVIGSADATKKLRFEVDGFTSGTTRVLTPPDADLTLAAVTAVGDMLYASASGILTRLAIGTTLQKFRVNAGATAPEWYTTPALTQPTRQVLTSGTSATYTTPAGATRINIRMVGGGGGGGATVTNAGTAGNNTTFSTLTAAGGGLGYPTASGAGAGGTATGGDINITGGTGQGGGSTSQPNTFPSGGAGGNTVFAGGGGGGANYAGGNGSTNSGGGGAGGGGASGIPAGSGGGGGGYVEKLIITPSATYTYTIAAAANGGAAGTFAGGNGGSGLIIVDEWYD